MAEIWHNGLTLRRWRLRNFKSVHEADIALAPLTVVVGANSAGKSTLIQSIRAVVQAAEVNGGIFPLNGDQVRLGTFHETRWEGARETDESVAIGGVFYLRQSEADDVRDHTTGYRELSRPQVIENIELDWTINLYGAPWGQPALTLLKSVDSAAQAESGQFELSVAVTEDVADGNSFERGRRFAGSVMNNGRRQQIIDTRMLGGFPVKILGRQDLISRLVDIWLTTARSSALARVRDSAIMPRTFDPAGEKKSAAIATGDVKKLAARITEDIKTLLDTWTEQEIASFAFEARERSAIRQVLSGREVLDFRVAAGDIIQILQLVKKDIGRTIYATRALPISEALNDVTEKARDFLSERVQHLGPLRMDPQVVYTSAPISRGGYIGDKGEYTAAALQANGKAFVSVPIPPSTAGSESRSRTVSTTLSNAVNQWAAYLGIGEEFSTTDQGRLGLALSVSQADIKSKLDLTSVGTGVSQLLPVLVMCLQAPPGSLLLIEQPELHLNPGVQQRLGDFLLSIARAGRQLIVETHSDYLVNRLRLHAIQDSSSDTSERVAIVFAERRQGATSYTVVHPTSDGSLAEWPEGFFDEAAKESERLLRAIVDRSKGGLL